MIKVNDYLNNELELNFRQGITYEFSLATFDTIFSSNAILVNDGSNLDAICGDVYGVPLFYDRLISSTEFASFEPNTYDVDNPKELYTEQSSTENIGIISESFYTQKTTASAPFFEKTVDFFDVPTQPYKMTGITIQFGNDKGIYPTHIILEFYNESNSIIQTIEDYPTGIVYTKLFSLIGATKLKIKVLEMSKYNVKLRISNIMSGTEVSFDNEITSVDVKRSSSPFATGLPSFECNIRLYDEDGLFDPQNPNGIYYTLNKPTISLYCVCNGIEELIGTYVMVDAPNTSGTEVSLKGISKTVHDISSNEGTINGYSDTPLYGLMETALQSSFADVDTTFIFENIVHYSALRNYSYVKNAKAKDIVSKVSNTVFGMFTEDKNGNVKIKTPILPNGDTDITLVLDKNKISGRIDLDTSTPILRTFSVQQYENGTGKKVENTIWGDAYADYKIDNNLIVGSDIYDFLRGCFNTWVKTTQKYKIPYMADPRIEVGDVVQFENEYGTTLYGIVAENNYSYPNINNGGLTVYTIPESVIGKG